MKKTLALLLALIMMLSVSLVACDNGNDVGNNGDDFEDDDGFVGITTTPSTDETDAESDTNNGNEDEWAVRNFTAYSMCMMYLRAEASRSAKAITTIEEKTQLTVVAEATISESGVETVWYKVSYNNQELYANSNYVTTNIEDTNFSAIEPTDQFTLTIKTPDTGVNTVNLRTILTYDKNLPEGHIISVSNVDTQTKPMTVVAKNATGTWYKVKYDNKDYYLAISSGTKPFLVGLPASDSQGGIIGG
ncbi:MAG: SH3 domain-containing protein [Ruminococcaceae bacterium]|nr:SH3 domain-containing protein [Oscillospiraceae bacterium]